MTDPKRAHVNSPARVKRSAHARMWRVVEGAVVNAFKEHPEYLTESGVDRAVTSITKRVIGNLIASGYEVRKDGCTCSPRPQVGLVPTDSVSSAEREGGCDTRPQTTPAR